MYDAGGQLVPFSNDYVNWASDYQDFSLFEPLTKLVDEIVVKANIRLYDKFGNLAIANVTFYFCGGEEISVSSQV